MSRPPAKSSRSPRFDSLQQEVFLNLWRTYDRLRALEDELFDQFQLTAQQYNVLRLLQAEHPEPLATLALAQRLISRAPDITRMLDKLEQQAWIERQRPPENRRTVLIRITPLGLALLEKIADPLQQCHMQQLGHLPEKDLQRLATLLRQARHPHENPKTPWN